MWIHSKRPEWHDKNIQVDKRKYKFRNLDLSLETPRCNQVSIGTKSLCMQDPNVWNYLLFQIKSRKSDNSKALLQYCSNYLFYDISVTITLLFFAY